MLARLNRPLSDLSLKFARAAWFAIVGLTVVVLLLGSVNVVRDYSDVCALPSRDVCRALETLGLSWLAPRGLALIALGSVLLIAVPWLAMGWLVFRRKSTSIAELLLSLGLATGWASDVCAHNIRFHFFREASALLPSDAPALIVTFVIAVVSQTSIVLVAYLVPDGRFFSRSSLVLALIWLVHITSNTFYRYPFERFGDSLLFGGLDYVFSLYAPVSMLYVIWFRLRHADSSRQRQQLRAILPSIVSLLVVTAAFSIWTDALWSGPDTTTLTTARLTAQFSQAAVQAAFAAWFALATGLAISRYNLFGFDLALSRTFVYGSLSATLLALFIAVVLGLGSMFGRETWAPLVATVAIALTLLPLHNALRSLVNRRLYGGRDTSPYEVLARLTSGATEGLALAELAQRIREVLKAPYAGVIVDAGQHRQEGRSGVPGGKLWQVPLLVQGSPMGHLEVSFREGELTDQSEGRLLSKVAEQVALIVKADLLASELTRAQHDVVESREQERLRLRRDLHDGLGPALAAQSMLAASARRLLADDPRRARALLSQLERELASTLEQARGLIYSLRPPELDDLGLVAALRAKVDDLTRGTVAVDFVTDDLEEPLPAAIEVALYRLVTEAVTNVVRHARATNCRVELRTSGTQISVSIADDGTGIVSDRKGVGLSAMQERVLELGGQLELHPASADGRGTVVSATLPLPSTTDDTLPLGAQTTTEGVK